MITPYFSVEQNDEFLQISIKISHIRFSAKSIEMVATGDLFVFSLPPYYLRLRLPFPVVDDERAKAEFDLKKGCVDIRLPKEVKGQHFPDLDLTAKLLARKEPSSSQSLNKPIIEDLDVVRNNSNRALVSTAAEDIEKEGRDHEWEIYQEEFEDVPMHGPKYGFNNCYSHVIGVSVANGNDINELSDPESCLAPDRIIERLIKENLKFDPEYYAADFLMERNPSCDDDKIFSSIFNWKSPTTRQFLTWYKSQRNIPESERQSAIPIDFSKDDHERMLSLPKKSYLIEERQKPQIWMLLITLLFAHQFDLRENEGEHNIESAWTIGKITPQFSFLDSQIFLSNDSKTTLLQATIINVTRRSLCYPLHRHFELSQKAWNDVYYLLRSGRRVILKSLLDLRELFRFHDVYYVYEKIWIEDLCLWLLSSHVSENVLRQLAHDFKRTLENVKKLDVTFEKIDGNGSENISVLNIEELEDMALESYNAVLG